MTSKPLKRIAADSNVLLSAVIGKAALRIFIETSLDVITTQFNIDEVEEYIPHLASKYHLPENALVFQLHLLPLAVYDEEYYKDKIPAARKYLEAYDLDDVHLGALALKEDVPIWSNDKDFGHFPIPTYTTADLLKRVLQ